MPQLDIDIFDDFLFFAFVSLLFGFGDEDADENIIEIGTDSYLAQYYIETRKLLTEQKKIVKHLFVNSVLHSRG
jgi:hypothetical protein